MMDFIFFLVYVVQYFTFLFLSRKRKLWSSSTTTGATLLLWGIKPGRTSNLNRCIRIFADDTDAADRSITLSCPVPGRLYYLSACACFRVRSQGKMFDFKNVKNPNFGWLSWFLSYTRSFSFFLGGNIPVLFRSIGESNWEDLDCALLLWFRKFSGFLVDLIRSDEINYRFANAK